MIPNNRFQISYKNFLVFHLKCLNEWKLKKEEQGYVYICELCQVPRDVEHIELTEKDKRKKLSLLKRCLLSCFGF